MKLKSPQSPAPKSRDKDRIQEAGNAGKQPVAVPARKGAAFALEVEVISEFNPHCRACGKRMERTQRRTRKFCASKCRVTAFRANKAPGPNSLRQKRKIPSAK